MKTVLQRLQSDKADCEDKLMKIKRAIESLQQVCNHDFQYLCNAHNYKIYECSICGANDKR